MKLTASTATAICPPEDVYVLEFTGYDDQGGKPDIFSKKNEQTYQIIAYFTIVNYDYDPDTDERDWNGYEIREYLKYAKSNEDGSDFKEVWNAPRAKARPIFWALAKREIQDGEVLDLDEFIGARMKATIKAKDSGYPKIEGAVALRGGKKQPVAVAATSDDDDEAFDDE